MNIHLRASDASDGPFYIGRITLIRVTRALNALFRSMCHLRHYDELNEGVGRMQPYTAQRRGTGVTRGSRDIQRGGGLVSPSRSSADTNG